MLRRMLAGAFGALLAAAGVEIWRELHSFSVTEYAAELPDESGKDEEWKVLFLSDLHNRSYGKDNEKLLDVIRRQKPDLILIGGDMPVGKPGVSPEPALHLVSRLTRLCPVCYAAGNHESRMKERKDLYGDVFPAYRQALEARGVLFLENESRTLRIKGRPIRICGLELPLSTYRKFRKEHLTAKDICSYVGPCGDAEEGDRPYTVLLAHNPAYMDAYLDWGADLILSGHLHGGLVRIPCLGGVVTPQGFLFPRYSGEMTKVGGSTVIVSRGLGTHTLNIRLFNRPELVVIRLKEKGSAPVKKRL